MYETPYTCDDDACDGRRAESKRCPWCWGGFPTNDMPVDTDPVGPVEAAVERLVDEQLERASFFARLSIYERSRVSQ